jgi:tetratricopeptide (TPR) repeat protein
MVVRLLEEALDALGPRHAVLRSRLLARLAVELYYAPDRGYAQSLSGQALGLARESSMDAALSEALSARHVTLWRPDHVDARLEVANEMVAVAEHAGDLVATLQGRNWRILDLFELGDRDSLDAELDAYARLAEEARLPAYQWYAPMWRATLALLEGHPNDARRLWSQARALGARAGDANAESFFGIVDSSHLPVEQGCFDRVDLDFHRQRTHSPGAGAAFSAGLARILAELGRHQEAREELERAAPGVLHSLTMDMNWLSSLAELARTCALLGDADRAAEGYELLRPYARLNIVDARAIYCYGSAAHYLGLYATTSGRSHEAREHYEVALRFNRRLRAWPHVCRTLQAYAGALTGTGGAADRELAARLTREAAHTAERLHMRHLIESADPAAPPAPA